MNPTTFPVSANLSMIVGDGPTAERITIPVQAQCYWEAGRFFIQGKAQVTQDVRLENGYRMRWEGELINPASYVGGMEALEAAAVSMQIASRVGSVLASMSVEDLCDMADDFAADNEGHCSTLPSHEDQPWQPHYADNDREYTQQPAVNLHD